MEERRLLWWYKLNTLQAKWYAFSPWLQKAHVYLKVGTPDQVCKGPKSLFVVEQLQFQVKPDTHCVFALDFSLFQLLKDS